MAEDSGSANRVLELRKSLREETTKREKLETAQALLDKQFKDKEKKLKQLKTEKATLDEQFRDLQKTSEINERKNVDLEAKRLKKKKKIKDLKDEKELLIKKFREAEKTAKMSDEQKRAMERRMKHRSQVLEGEVASLESEAQQLKDSQAKITQEVDVRSTSSDHELRRVESARYMREKEDSDRIKSLEDDKKELERKLRESQRKIDELESENNRLKEAAKQIGDKSSSKIAKMEEKVSGLTEKLRSVQDKSDVLQMKVIEEERQRKEDKLLEKLQEDNIPSSVERKSTISSVPDESKSNADAKVDDILAKEPGAERAKIWEYHPNSEKWDDGKWSMQLVVISMEKRPFAEGSLRTAYMTKNLSSGERYVTKISKNRAHGREIYENDVEMQVFCMRLAEKYNSEGPPKKVYFTNAYLVELIDRPRSPIATMELYMEGEYKKYSNNDGATRYDRNTPQAFSHFTYERSNHDLIVIDIQGVDDVYTDPQVHTKDHKGFGIGNLGQKGIVKFVITHQCNAICKHLKLPPIQEKYGKTTEIKMDKGTMPFPRDVVKMIDTSDGVQIKQDAQNCSVDLTSIKCVETIKGEDKVGAVCLSYRYLFVGAASNVSIYKLGNFELHGTLKGHCDNVESLCVNDEFLFSGGADKDIRVWDLQTLKCVKIITDHTSNIKALLVDTAHIYSGSHDKTVRVWNLKDYSCDVVLHGHEKFVKALALSKDSRVLFSGGNDNTIKVWDLKTYECIYNLDSHTKWIKSLFVSGQYLFSGANDKRIKVWDLKTLDLVQSLKHHSDKINAVLAAGDFLVSASDDAMIKLYDYKTLECIFTISEHKGSVVSVCHNDKYMVSASFDGIKIWTWSKQ